MKSSVLVPLLILGTGSTAAPIGSQQPASAPVFRSGANLVALSVTVVDAEKRFVGGLEAGDFAVYEDGVKQELRFFESAAVPIDLIILLDTSSSMRHRIDTVHQAALGFIRTLRPDDRGAVVAFNDGIDVVQPLTSDHARLESAIKSTSARGATALHNALYVALKEFGRAPGEGGGVRRQALTVLSDGDDTTSLISFTDVLEVARKTGVAIYTIALLPESDQTPKGRGQILTNSQYSLRQLAQETGAQAFFPHTIHELDGIYLAIAEELAHQYSLGYVSTDARSDGRFRRVAVRVTSRPDVRPRARTGYLSPGVPGGAADRIQR